MIEIEIAGLNDLIERLDRRLGMGGVDETLGAIVAEKAREQTLRRFDSKIAPDGTPWAPRKREAKHGLLTKTGHLRNSVYGQPIEQGAIIGTNVFYAGFHQHGTSRMPARSFLGVGPADEAEIVEAIESFIASVLSDEK